MHIHTDLTEGSPVAVTRAEQNRKDAGAKFRDLMDKNLAHVRVGQGRADGTLVTLVGHASQLHGLDGCCTCCPRRDSDDTHD
jgi:hypothetical protein